MYQLTTDKLSSLMAAHDPPCISIYQPTHRHHPENQQDPIRFRNLIRTVEESLLRHSEQRDVEKRLEPLRELASNRHFWNHTRDGLAVLLNSDVLEIIQIQRTFPELAIVANSFHIKPLLRYLQSADRFQVLALTRDSAVVFAGNRYALDEEPVNDEFPSRLEQVAMAERGEPRASVAGSSGGVGSPKIMHGHDENRDDIETEKYFRAVDRAFTTQFSGPSGLPVLLAALPEHQALFRRVSQNQLLQPEGTNSNPRALSTDSLRQQAWGVLEPYYLARLDELGESYRTAAARQSGSAILSEVAQAAVAGRVGTLLLEADRIIPGVIDRTTGAVRSCDLQTPEADDMLDDLAELVLGKGGTVVVVPSERMPAPTGLAASYRY
ncbi:MAG: hypothetical protein IPI34_13655 [bacterium]|nr:hypothetical protein [bacterium]